jgi:hypothetical protein
MLPNKADPKVGVNLMVIKTDFLINDMLSPISAIRKQLLNIILV